MNGFLIVKMSTAIAAIVKELIIHYDEKKSCDLNSIINRISREYKLPKTPRLVDVIQGIPHNYKSKLLPLIRAKPIRTASGIAVTLCFLVLN